MLHQTSRWPILIWLPILSFFLAGMGPISQGQGAGNPNTESLETILEGLLSQNCQTRKSSTENFKRYVKKKDLDNVISLLAETNQSALDYLRPFLQYLMKEDQATSIWLREMRKTYKDTEGAIPLVDRNESEFSRVYLTKLLNDIENRPLVEQALFIGYVAERAKFYSAPQLYSLGKEYEVALENLVSGSQLELKILAASGLLWRNPQRFSKLTPVILEGLSHQEFSIRNIAFISLKDILPGIICYNPLDYPEERGKVLKGIRQWWDSQQTKNSAFKD